MNTERITVTSMWIADDQEAAARAVGVGTEESRMVEGRALYRFEATGSANTGTAYIGEDAVAIEWGGDPQWFHAPSAHSHQFIIEMALNDELEEA